MHARAALIDTVLREVWRAQLGAAGAAPGRWSRSAATAARSCIPHRTSTFWCWCRRAVDPPGAPRIEKLVAFLWDIGLEVGHSVRTVEECAQESAPDVGVMTTLLEARRSPAIAQLLRGDARRARAGAHLAGARILRGQAARAAASGTLKANDTAYNLEPNVKTGPGGLRDIQTIAWVAKRHFGANSLDELATQLF